MKKTEVRRMLKMKEHPDELLKTKGRKFDPDECMKTKHLQRFHVTD
jgi:hypothetical protein